MSKRNPATGRFADTWADLADAVKEESLSAHRGHCSVGAFLRTLSDVDRSAMEAVLDNPRLSSAAIHRVLKSRTSDTIPGLSALGRHRREDCRCPRGAK